MVTIHPLLKPFVAAVREAGFDVHVPKPFRYDVSGRYVYITRIGMPGCVLMQVPTLSRLIPHPDFSVPIRPSREHGSAVHMDFEGTPEELPAALEPVIARSTVFTRFEARPVEMPVVARIPMDADVLPATALAATP